MSGELVEKVARAIEEHFSSADKAYLEHHKCARDAIKALAEWIGPEYCVTRGNLLKQCEEWDARA